MSKLHSRCPTPQVVYLAAMELEQDQGFLGPITSLCCHLTAGQSSVAPAITTPQLKKIRANALKNILFPGDTQCDDNSSVSELCRLHAAWFVLDSAGRHESAARLHALLERLGPEPAPPVRAVLRLLLALADRRLGQPPPPPPLGRFGTRLGTEAPWQRGPPMYSTECLTRETSRHYTEFPARAFAADGSLPSAGAPPPGLFELPPGQGVGLSLEQALLSAPGGPLGALVQSRSTAAPGERLRLPPLPSDPRRVPFAPETLCRPLGGAPLASSSAAGVTRLGCQETRSQSPEWDITSDRCPSPAGSDDPTSWEAAARDPPASERLCWEQRGRRQYERLPPPLTQLGPTAVPRLRRLLLSWGGATVTAPRPMEMSELLAQLRLMMMGLNTDCFPYHAATGAFLVAEGLCTERCSPEAVAARCGAWVSCGSRCRRVAALAAAGGGGCLTGRAFAAAVEPCLRGYRAALAEVQANTLAEFGRRVQPLVRLMALLADVCCVTTSDSELPQKMALVSHLYERLIGASERTEWALIAHLFRSTVTPYLNFLTGWLLEGVCRDPCDEFAVRQMPSAAAALDETFWTSAYEQVPAGTDNDHPSFLQTLSAGMYQCGKALSLLRLCDSTHPLVQPPADLRVRLAFSLPELEETEHKMISYEAAMQCHVANTLTRQLSERTRRERELETAAGRRRQTAISSIQETMLAQRRRRAEQKRQLLEDQLRDVERSRQVARNQRLEDRLRTEQAERERQQDEVAALRRENETRLARLHRFTTPEQLNAMRAQLRLDEAKREATAATTTTSTTATTKATATIVPTAAATAGADAAEPMFTSADPSPATETAPSNTPEEETAETLDGEPTSESSTDKNITGDTANDVTEGLLDGGTSWERATGEVDNANAPVANITATEKGEAKTDNETTTRPAGSVDNQTSAVDSEGNTDPGNEVPTSGVVTRTDDASNANTATSTDENANTPAGLSPPASSTSGPTEAIRDVTTTAAAAGSDITAGNSNLTAAAAPELTTDAATAEAASPSRAALAERRRVIRRRALGEDGGVDGATEEPVLVDQIGGEVLRPRGRNIHGHATDSVIERLLYRGGGGAPAAAGAPLPDRRRRVTVRSDDTVVRFQPPDFTVAMLPSAASAASTVRRLIAEERREGQREEEKREEEEEWGRTEPQLGGSNQFTLAGTLQHSVALLLNAQLSLVNAALLNHLLVDQGLMEHLETLRRFLLLADGEFSARLCSQLFHLVGTVRTPHQLLSPATLNSVLSEALSASVCGDHPLAERLSFVANDVPDVLDKSSPTVLTCLDMEYRAGWPHCLVLTDKCMARYKAIFHLFLQLRRAVWALERVFSLLKAAGEVSAARGGGGPQLQRLQLCRHEMQHFVLALQGYLTSQVLQVSWAELRRELQNSVHTLDELRAAHTAYIGHAAKRCLLNAKSEPIMKIVQDVLRIVLKLHAQLISVEWSVDGEGRVTHPAFAAVMKTHRQFSGYSRFLFKVVNKTKDRFYQPHLNDLANRLNFNGFYTADLGPV